MRHHFELSVCRRTSIFPRSMPTEGKACMTNGNRTSDRFCEHASKTAEVCADLPAMAPRCAHSIAPRRERKRMATSHVEQRRQFVTQT